MLRDARFDMFNRHDRELYNELLCDPSIVIERRSLKWVEIPGRDGEDPEEELILSIRYTKYPEDIDEQNIFKKARLMTVPPFGSNGYTEYENFVESLGENLLFTNKSFRGQTMLAVLEFIDPDHQINECFEGSIRNRNSNEIYFDSKLQQYMTKVVQD